MVALWAAPPFPSVGRSVGREPRSLARSKEGVVVLFILLAPFFSRWRAFVWNEWETLPFVRETSARCEAGVRPLLCARPKTGDLEGPLLAPTPARRHAVAVAVAAKTRTAGAPTTSTVLFQTRPIDQSSDH